MTSAQDFKLERWTSSSNDALKISIVNNSEDKAIQFKPNFTYPLYGDKETIFGFKDLTIHLVFDSVTFKPFINAKYSASIKNYDNVLKILGDNLPENDFIMKDENKWRDICKNEHKTYSLPDEKYKIGEYAIGNSNKFAIYKVKLSENPNLLKLHRRIQILSLFFIEGASYIDTEEPLWDIYWLFNTETKECIGFATTYKYWYYGGHLNFDSQNYKKQYRAKISQFLILPPYQGKSHGTQLYSHIYDSWKTDFSVVEVTIEDPNESFDDLRDINDLMMLSEEKFFASLENKLQNNNLQISVWLEDQRTHFKLEKRQFERCVEMILLYLQSDKEYNAFVKKRLYRKNFEALNDIPDNDGKIKAINNSFNLLTEDYHRILEKFSNFKRKYNQK